MTAKKPVAETFYYLITPQHPTHTPLGPYENEPMFFIDYLPTADDLQTAADALGYPVDDLCIYQVKKTEGTIEKTVKVTF